MDFNFIRIPSHTENTVYLDAQFNKNSDSLSQKVIHTHYEN